MNSFIAIDQVIFLDGENQCDILPKEADPTLTTTTTTTTPSTTPVPSTEPPDGTIYINLTYQYHWIFDLCFENFQQLSFVTLKLMVIVIGIETQVL